MALTVSFDVLHQYDAALDDIIVPVKLSAGAKVVEFGAKLDTGAACCIFQRHYARMLGFTVEDGKRRAFAMASGRPFIAFGHQVTLSALEFHFESRVYFAEDPDFQRNVLGREDWIRRVKLGMVDVDGLLYVGVPSA